MTSKREQLEHLLGNSNIDFLGLTETWITSSSPEALITMPGYDTFRKDREKGRGGGVLLYVKSTIKCKLIKWPRGTDIECVGVKISLSAEMSLTLICMYRKPSAKLKALLNNCDFNKEVIIMGDFNINWNDKSGRRNLKNITDYCNLTQLIEQPTRITRRSETRIDLLFTNRTETVTKPHNIVA